MTLKVLQEGVGLPLPDPDTFRGRQVHLLTQPYPFTVGRPVASEDDYPALWASGSEDLGSILWPTDAWAIVEWED